MRDQSSHGARSRERVAENVYRRRTTRGDTVYELTFRDVDGRQHTCKLDARSERAAAREARRILAGRDGGDRVVAASLTLGQLADRDYFPLIRSLAAAGRRSERNVDDTHDRWRIHLEPRLGDLRLAAIEPRHVAELIREMRDAGYAEGTIAGALVVLRALYRLARSRGYVARSPVDGLDPAETPRPRLGGAGRVLDEQELAALVRHAPDHHRVIVTVLSYTGLRISEALGLLWRDVDFVERELRIRQQLQPARGDRPAKLVSLKTAASERHVPMFPAVERALQDALELRLAVLHERDGDSFDPRALDDQLVFVTRAGTPLAHRNVAQRGVGEAAKRAGMGKVTPHDLRRSVCSLAGRRGVDPIEAAQITGHSPAVWARFYARSFGKAQRDEARDRLLEHGFGTTADCDAAGDARRDGR